MNRHSPDKRGVRGWKNYREGTAWPIARESSMAIGWWAKERDVGAEAGRVGARMCRALRPWLGPWLSS